MNYCSCGLLVSFVCCRYNVFYILYVHVCCMYFSSCMYVVCILYLVCMLYVFYILYVCCMYFISCMYVVCILYLVCMLYVFYVLYMYVCCCFVACTIFLVCVFQLEYDKLPYSTQPADHRTRLKEVGSRVEQCCFIVLLHNYDSRSHNYIVDTCIMLIIAIISIFKNYVQFCNSFCMLHYHSADYK